MGHVACGGEWRERGRPAEARQEGEKKGGKGRNVGKKGRKKGKEGRTGRRRGEKGRRRGAASAQVA